jgi:lysosomal Pro-X carboxypeptidase
MLMPMQTTGVSDMFWPAPWNETQQLESCFQQFSLKPRVSWITTNYGIQNLKSFSNIVFSNGVYDPWSGGGVMQNISDSVISVVIEAGAHHLDLMWSNPLDNDSVKAARSIEIQNIATWIQQYHAGRKGK